MRAWQKSGFKNLPQGWEIVCLGDIGKIYQPKTISQAEFTQDGYLVYGANGVIGRYSDYNHEHEQIAVACRGNTCGVVNFTKPKSWITGNAMVVNLDDSVRANKLFIYFSLSRMSFDYLITGSGQPQITSVIKSHKLPLPPLKEQEKIAEILNLWDAQIAEVQDLIYHKQRLKTGLMQKLFTQSLRLKGFAESWSKVRLGDITEIKRGQTITEATRIDGDIPVIAGGKQPAYFCDRYNRTGENITISSSGTAGFVNYFATPIFASDCFTIQGLENLAITKYLYYYLKSIQNKIYSLQSGSVQTHVYPSDMEGMRLHLPPLKEQEKIAEILSVADEEIELLVQKHQALETQKHALMQRLLTGKVRV